MEFLIAWSIERLNSRSLLGGVCAKKFASNKIGVKEMASREMYKAVCSECGQECEVPFKPDGTRPVYCRDCYAKRRGPRRR
ncbi:MAG: hypothetical protein Metus_0053 [Candidatus Methanosuratincola subterraneus]|jgi:CxxC-x17-CxxC domain-containing protein|uniref:CxxC-x17-CxxC domain-containing protein n=2 Tax=Candidatus Methanosuratincola (ex Vanwonterghem et al. 2016) TaxID=1915412 RepID=A0A3S3RCR9_METS7|nr:MAG: hypothetical protein Metus_0053 [Candidatus Methanosuratincola subterraneus]